MPPTFCPYCCNSLTISKAAATPDNPHGRNAFTCRTCPYQFVLDQPYYERTYMKRKQKDDILGEDQTDLPVNEVPGGCPNEKCSSKRAYFYQLQTRSADEPPTSFYKCIECSKQWREYWAAASLSDLNLPALAERYISHEQLMADSLRKSVNKRARRQHIDSVVMSYSTTSAWVFWLLASGVQNIGDAIEDVASIAHLRIIEQWSVDEVTYQDERLLPAQKLLAVLFGNWGQESVIWLAQP